MPNRISINEPSYALVFESKQGLVGRDLDRRAARVEAGARAQVGVDTGELKRSIRRYWRRANGRRLSVSIGSSARHARVHHEGSRPHVIRARSAKALRYTGADGQVMFAKSVSHPGTRPNRFLTDNLSLFHRN